MMLSKHKKAPTGPELWKQRKQKEEDERTACLPPGLINHGNTCFMNSTLQGLIATRMLHSLLTSGQVATHWNTYTGAPILAKRSPLLTNGHGIGGDFELERVEGMLLGDTFVATMQKAWELQDSGKKQSMSPKDILTRIGAKYDQYQDFQQQDAHEFLRHLLDAMRMEELDLIKKRQPPPPKTKRKKSLRKASNDASSSKIKSNGTAISPEDKLESFVDMIFGGRLASILVCETCKKISLTHEDFNDLSLSIKPEDYVRERKRDRFRQLARKFRLLPPKELELPPLLQRSSSVPASPHRRSAEGSHPSEEHPPPDEPRRQSVDHPGEGSKPTEEPKATDPPPDTSLASGVSAKSIPPADEDGDWEAVNEPPETKTSPHVGFADAVKPVRVEGDKKEKEDAWGKLGRRISVSMKMGVGGKKDKRMSRSMERGSPKLSHLKEDTSGAKTDDGIARSSLAAGRHAYESGSDMGDVSDATKSRGVSPVRLPQPSSASIQSTSTSSAAHPVFPPLRRTSTEPYPNKRSKSPSKPPRPPKPTREQSEYLRRILADVHPNGSSNTLAMLTQALSTGHLTPPAGSSPTTAQVMLSKLGHLPSIEDCLRLFTAVEILEGENMVGCHRCWKIQQGTYVPRKKEEQDQESEDSEEDPPKIVDVNQIVEEIVEETSSAIPPALISPTSTDVTSRYTSASSILLPETASSRSAPTTLQTIPSSTDKLIESHSLDSTESYFPSPAPIVPTPSVTPSHSSHPIQTPTPPHNVTTFGGQPIPLISTTAPDAPISPLAAGQLPSTVRLVSDNAISTESGNLSSLLTPNGSRTLRSSKHVRQPNGLSEDLESSDDEFDDSASDASGSVSAFSDASSIVSPPGSPSVSPRASRENLRSLPPLPTSPSRPELPRTHSAESSETHPPKIPRSQQVIMRRTYKRYLVADPPPILVVHLKRFQQISKTYAVSFSSGFKKLDDFVSFPEYLDLTPFLAPKRSEHSTAKDKSKSKKKEDDEKCIYRLYTVVVHTGNMLGGHYIAYTALPQRTPTQPPSPEIDSDPPPHSIQPHPLPKSPDSEHTNTRRQWAYVSDTVVRVTTLEEVLKAKAYICMYERL